MKETQETIGQWCHDTFPTYNSSKGRMVAILEEAIELGVAEGLMPSQIEQIVNASLSRAVFQIEEPEAYKSETGDLLMNTLAYAEEKRFDAWEEMEKKMEFNRGRPQEFYDNKLQQKRAAGLRPELV